MANQYDDSKFFARYAQMPRSQSGLSAAGEWHQLEPLIPCLEGKRVLDLGCGYGWHCRYALEQGAVKVLGIDSSRRMLKEARSRGGGEALEYSLCSITEYEYPESAWDVVLSNLALHYVEDLPPVYHKVYHTLVPGGVFLFNIEHPTFTAGVGQDWSYAPDGTPLHWPVDDYFRPGPRVTHFLGSEVTKYHHSLTQILMPLLEMGFRLTAVEEAQPPLEMLSQPGWLDELRRPMMLLVRAEKPV